MEQQLLKLNAEIYTYDTLVSKLTKNGKKNIYTIPGVTLVKTYKVMLENNGMLTDINKHRVNGEQKHTIFKVPKCDCNKGRYPYLSYIPCEHTTYIIDQNPGGYHSYIKKEDAIRHKNNTKISCAIREIYTNIKDIVKITEKKEPFICSKIMHISPCISDED